MTITQAIKTLINRLVELPKGLKVMKNLWFLEMTHFGSLLCTPPGLRNLTCLHRLSIFIVGQDEAHQIDQLKDLDLEDELSIQGLDNVGSLQDARRANLMTKLNLTCLRLSWKKGNKMNSAEHFEKVLEGLQPHQNIKKISIASYHGSRFPNWMSTLVFRQLKEISLQDCPRCEHLPPLGKMPSLASLILYKMDSIKCLDECYIDGETSFPSLTSLSIHSMPNFERWAMVDSAESFPFLEQLEIWSCPKLAGIPELPTLKSLNITSSSTLKSLNITSSSTSILKSITLLTSLTSLTISSFEELDVFPRGLLQNHKALEQLDICSLPIRTLSNMLDNLTALKTLHINCCHSLEFLPEYFKYLSSLENLDIRGCDGLISFPISLLEGLCSLRSLSFQYCMKLKPLMGPLQQSPPALHELLLNGLPELEYLPENVQLLRSLTDLVIYHCERFCTLPNWLEHLEALSVIEIWYCEKLKSLPDGFKDLKSLKKLEIKGCSQLEKRCKKPKGEDWPKISHIPFIKINDNIIQHLD